MTPASLDNLMRQFLVWVADHPRTYAQTMDAWRTTCPRLTIWEDALAAGLIKVEKKASPPAAVVTLTPLGREALSGAEGEG